MGGPSVTSNGTVEIAAQQSDDKTIVLVVGGTGAQSLAAGASVATVVSRATIEGTIESGARVTAPTIAVTAQQTGNDLTNSGGGVAGAQSAAIGAAVVVNDLADQVRAKIFRALSATVDGDILVSANVNSNINRAIAVGGAGVQTFALSGICRPHKIGGTTEAIIADGAQVTAPGSISVSANRATDAHTIGGAGTAAFGIGNAALLSTEQTLATVGTPGSTQAGPARDSLSRPVSMGRSSTSKRSGASRSRRRPRMTCAPSRPAAPTQELRRSPARPPWPRWTRPRPRRSARILLCSRQTSTSSPRM
jgi:hypothetical protein